MPGVALVTGTRPKQRRSFVNLHIDTESSNIYPIHVIPKLDTDVLTASYVITWKHCCFARLFPGGFNIEVSSWWTMKQKMKLLGLLPPKMMLIKIVIDKFTTCTVQSCMVKVRSCSFGWRWPWVYLPFHACILCYQQPTCGLLKVTLN